HHQQPLLADQVAEDVLLHALLQDAAKVVLAQDLRDLTRRGERASHQRAQRRQVALALLPLRGDELPALIEQDGVARAGVERQSPQDTSDVGQLALRYDEIGELLHAQPLASPRSRRATRAAPASPCSSPGANVGNVTPSLYGLARPPASSVGLSERHAATCARRLPTRRSVRFSPLSMGQKPT